MARNTDIFRTLKNYSHGFHTHNDEENNKAYDAKVAELTEKIRADTGHAPEIIQQAFGEFEIKRIRALLDGTGNVHVYDAEWKAIDNVMCSLIDTKPLKK